MKPNMNIFHRLTKNKSKIRIVHQTWIHGDEDTTTPDQIYLSTLKHKSGRAGSQSRQDAEDLLSHYREYLCE